MQVSQVIMYIMAVGALIGGVDLILGNRLGYGERFEEAFRLLGPIGLSMAGIICLAPVLSNLLGYVVVPLFQALDLDPAMFGSVLAIDMGGYQLAMDLAVDPEIGKFSGIIVSAIFGCTIVFTIPVSLSVMGEDDRAYFTKGILLGLVSMPVAIVGGGLACGLPFGKVLWNTMPMLLISALLFIGIVRNPKAMARGFQVFAKLIQALATFGLILGAVQYMTGLEILKGLTPLPEAMEIVCSIAIVMLGSMPLAELVKRILKVPCGWIGKHTGLNSTSTTGILIGMVSVVPALATIPHMDKRGKVVNGAFVVCGASAFAAHLGFAVSTQPEMVPALLAVKLLGGFLGVAIALLATRNIQ
ncbi:MAG: ethanolamine utilization protein EutH [Faecousia sp.]